MIGQLVGSYRILRQIGEGGMGRVYLAEHQLIGKRAAVKVLLPEFCANAEIVTRFPVGIMIVWPEKLRERRHRAVYVVRRKQCTASPVGKRQ